MSIEKTLNVQKRDARGKGANGRLRSRDMVPGVFYTASGENIMVQAPTLPLEKLYESVGHTTVFNLEIENDGAKEVHPVLIWQVQRHPYKNCFLEWAPGRWQIQIPLPRKNRVKLRSTEPRDTVFDFPEYSASICQSCKTVLFQYQ